jgi:hypothetical protein
VGRAHRERSGGAPWLDVGPGRARRRPRPGTPASLQPRRAGRVESGELARSTGRPGGGLPGSAGSLGGRRDPPAPPSARDVVGDRATAAAPRRRAGGEALRAAGRRLRGDARRVPPRPHLEQAQDPAPDVARARARDEEARRAGRPDGRPVREAPEPAARGAGGRVGRHGVAAQLFRRSREPRGVLAERARGARPIRSFS